MPSLPRGLFLGLCVLVLLETIAAQISKDPQCNIRCTQHATCINMTHCSCDKGFASASGKKYFDDFLENCDDINECAGSTGIFCGKDADCINTEGSYHCECISGYGLPSGDKTFPNETMNNCQDIDECHFNSLLCEPHGVCTNTPRTYICMCELSFAKSNKKSLTTCMYVDECSGPKAISCGQNADCVNTPGGYHCECRPGYGLPSGEKTFPNETMNDCQDVDECHLNSLLCEPHGVCTNTPRTYICMCKLGFAKSNKEPLTTCLYVDECSGPKAISCGQNADCVNTPGGYLCECRPGYALSSGEMTFPNETMNSCRDVDECQLNSSLCEPHGVCKNTTRSYMCVCKSGFAKSNKNSLTTCMEIKMNIQNKPLCEPNGIYVDECSGPKTISCGQNADCVNTPGGYHCECKPRYALPSGEKTFPNETMNDCQDPGTSFPPWTPPPGVNKDFLNQLKSTTRKFKPNSTEESIKGFVKDMEELLSTATTLEDLSLESRLQVVTYLLSNFEQILRNLAQSLTKQLLVFHTVKGSELSMNIMEKPTGTVEVGRSHTKMKLDWNLTGKRGSSEKAVVGLFSTHELKTLLTKAPLVLDPGMHADLEQANEAPVRESIPELLSAVSIAFLNTKDTEHLSSPVTFAFSHPNVTEGPRQRVICAFWQHNSKGSGQWATTGCKKLGSVGTSTTCQCTHLSSFAILMAHYDVEDWALSVVTKVGLGLSLACLLLCILTFLLCRSIQGSRTTIHLHLCLCLFVGSTVFLAGSANPGQGEVGLRCRLVAGLLHYCFLAAFCWMCLEGLELYFLVVRVFPGPGLPTRWLCLLGYGTPALIVAVSAAVYHPGYGRPRYCWLSLEKGFIWSFLGPVTLIIAFNAFIFVITVWKLTQKFSEINPDMKKLKKARMLTFTAIAQLCILGCTWIFGLFLFGPENHVLAYIFTILNCFQGCFLFLLHCLLNKKVREEYRRWACIVTKNKYNEFSTSTTSQSRALRPSLESGM